MFLRDCDDDVPFREPVNQRVWALQQNILSPRLLEYGYERGGSTQSPGQYSPRFISPTRSGQTEERILMADEQ
ncbi:unnamed protein product [Clonostachys chloroleuca]|uniref:Uncharacterized protein n=1 Tax=Clonostachys chloroleuca TaxID=1926264 RepID=A0AA35Q2Y2_9HYPO|nr:unnamed protein product [Clonostachys chloroleuca]